jgi:hypothetical protein
MSHHCFSTQYDGSPITVTLGWERRYGFFLVIEDESEPDPKDEFYIYFLTNPTYIYHYLHDDNLTESPETRLTDDLDYFSRVLKRYEIVVPDRMIANVNADAVLNVTDSVWSYVFDAAGNLVVNNLTPERPGLKIG